MNRIKDLCVIIPVHKPELSKAEEISLKQCRKILLKYPVFLIYPHNVNTNAYTDIYPELNLAPVPLFWLDSLSSYNKMKCSLSFYELFKQYKFMMTYELDAFIFSDNWNQCSTFNFDYIGAPWYEGLTKADKNSEITGVGNSGFSIRNINRCIEVLKDIEKVRNVWNLFHKFRVYKLLKFSYIARIFNPAWNINVTNEDVFVLMKTKGENEDVFWTRSVYQAFFFKIADTTNAYKFSFEVNPSKLFELNNSTLPIGCHAWEKFELPFWKNFIEQEGYTLEQ